MGYELYSGSDGLAQIGGDWEALERRAPGHIFQTLAYARTWDETIGQPSGATPLIAVLREDDQVVGLFPAARVRTGGVSVLTWLGGPGVFDYGDVLFDASASKTSVTEFVDWALALLKGHARGSFLYLSNVRDDAVAIGPLRERLRVYKQSAAPYVEVQGDYDTYLRSLDKHARHDLRRRGRRLAEAGTVEYKMIASGDPDATSAMERLIEWQHDRFRGGFGRTEASDRRYADFRRAQVARDPYTRVATLSLDGKTIAASLHVVYRGRMYCLMPAFDTEYSQYSPSMLLKARVLETCFDEGLNPCDFCWGDESYKYMWTKLDIPMTTFVSEGAGGAFIVGISDVARRVTRVTKATPADKLKAPSVTP